MIFGERLKELRKEKGLTQEDIGKLINLKKSNISKYERGDLEPNIDVIKILSSYFDVTTDYLLGKTDRRNYDYEIKTIAAHKDNDNEWTEEELDEIEKFKEFVRMKRSQNK